MELKNEMEHADLNKILFFNGERIMIVVCEDIIIIKKENKSDEYVIGENNPLYDTHASIKHSIEPPWYRLISWKFIGIHDEIEAVFQCSKCNEKFTDLYDFAETMTYKELGIKSPFNEN